MLNSTPAFALLQVADGFVLLILVFFALFIWLSPFLLILSSSRTRGREKLAWLLAMLFISWFAWIFYLLLAPLRKN